MVSYNKIFKGGYDEASRCGEHTLGFSPKDVAGVLWAFWDADEGSDFEKRGTDDRTVSLCCLKDGKFGVLEECEDYTGHGCQCSGSADIFDTLEKAMRLGLNAEDREKAKAALSEEKKKREKK